MTRYPKTTITAAAQEAAASARAQDPARPMSEPHSIPVDKLAPTFAPARYAKGKVAVRCPSDGSGYKTRAMRIASTVSGRYSGREHAYIVSPAAARKIRAAYAAEQDAQLGDVRGRLGFTMVDQDPLPELRREVVVDGRYRGVIDDKTPDDERERDGSPL